MPASRPRGPVDPSRAGVPSADEPLVAAASEVLGGPLGRHARLERTRWGGTGPRRRLLVLPARPIAAVLAIVVAVFVGLGAVQKSYCFTHGWGGSEVFWRACYSDLPRMYVTSGLVTGSMPYGDAGTAVNQPAGTGLVLWAMAQVVPSGPREATWFVAAWTVLAVVLAVVLVTATTLTLRRDPWRAAQVAACPLLITTVLVAPDLLGVALVAVGLLLWAREKPVWAGLALGAAASARSYAALVVIVLVFIAARAGVPRVAARTAAVAAATWAGVLLLVGLVAGGGVLAPYQSWLGAGAEYGAPVYLGNLMGYDMPLGMLTALAIAGWVVALIAGAVLTFVPAHRPKVAEVLVLVLVVVLLTSKTIPVQATLALAPLAALAGLRWRDVIGWWVAELLYFVAVWLYLGGQDEPTRALPQEWYAFFLVLRCAALVYLAYRVTVTALRRPAAVPPDQPLPEEFGLLDDPDTLDDLGAPGEPADEAAIAARRDPDDAAGPAAGRDDALVVTFG